MLVGVVCDDWSVRSSTRPIQPTYIHVRRLSNPPPLKLTGDPAAEAAMRAAERHMKASAPPAWTDQITSDKWYASIEKKGPHAPGQPLAVREPSILCVGWLMLVVIDLGV